MRRAFAFFVVVCFVVLLNGGRSVAQGTAPAQTAPPAQTAKPSIDTVLKAVRDDLQGTRADIMAKNLTLTAAEAAKFWPLFDKYQQQQNAIMDEQLKGIQRYADSFEKLDDAGALALMQAHFDRDTKMNTLRQQFLKEFQTVVPARTAARAMQIDRRLALMTQIEIASRIPLIH